MNVYWIIIILWYNTNTPLVTMQHEKVGRGIYPTRINIIHPISIYSWKQ